MSFWSKLGKGLAIGGNIALPFLTGGLSLPAQIAISSAAGAGTGALTGGKKGALLGGALGALPGVGQIGKGAGEMGYIDDAIKGVAGSGAAKTGGGILDFLTKMKSAGLDPTTLALGGMSLLGGDGQELDPYTGKVAPQALLEQAMASINQGRPQPSEATLSRRRLPEPVRVDVPGIPFQIGGGLATDPALRAHQEASTQGSVENAFQQPPAGTELAQQMKSTRRKPSSGSEQV